MRKIYGKYSISASGLQIFQLSGKEKAGSGVFFPQPFIDFCLKADKERSAALYARGQESLPHIISGLGISRK
jgi:hypothetical protein